MKKRVGPRGELRILRRFVAEVEDRYLKPHLSSPILSTPSRQEVLDTAAFVVLVHGALENFVEGVALWTLESVERTWLGSRRASKCLASMFLYGKEQSDEFGSGLSVFDNIRQAIAEAKASKSQSIYANNGIAVEHLRAMFRPLGVDVPEDPTLTGSLELLVSMRHQWAHQYRFGAKVTKFAVDVKKTADDCLELASMLAGEAVKSRP